MVKGKVALLGSGEMSGTMVETHKKLLAGINRSGKVLFLDTPAGFQENVDLISRRALDYFARRVGTAMEVASFKSAEQVTDAEPVFRRLEVAKYVLIGPGSPTYAVKQLKNTVLPTLLGAVVSRGGCLVMASAAALTAGTDTLPVYEIYKVGEALHWVGGLNILGHLGLELVVIPHWNNAEGGNHDTRYCYMGERRFSILESKLPEDAVILGIDEHTACILDFTTRQAFIEGLGRVTVRCNGIENVYAAGETLNFTKLIKPSNPAEVEQTRLKPEIARKEEEKLTGESSFWQQLHAEESAFHAVLEKRDSAGLTNALLETDRLLWQAQLDLENPEFVTQGRELFREMIVLAGTALKESAEEVPVRYRELVAGLVELREDFRCRESWPEADRIRDLLQAAGVFIEDRADGPFWFFHSSEKG